jgi:hypothetical protein
MFSFKPRDEFFAFALGAGGNRTPAHHKQIRLGIYVGGFPAVGQESCFVIQRFGAVESAAEGYETRFHGGYLTPVADEMTW